MKQQIFTVFGNRPQFIKSATVSKMLLEFGMQEILINTGQHFDANMSDIFFRELNIKDVDYNLNITNAISDLDFIASTMIALEKLFRKLKPNLVLLYGDTNTTLTGAIVAKKLGITVAHIEGGARFQDLSVPEEYNRILVDNSSDILFASDFLSVQNLRREGFKEQSIIFSGDVMFDLFLQMKSLFIKSKYSKTFRRYYLATFHRQENVDTLDALLNLYDTLCSTNQHIVFPLHPRTKRRLIEYNLYDKLLEHPKIHLERPMSYLEMMGLLSDAELVLTDSGGLQKEAFFAQIPCYVFLNTSPWQEIENLGWQKVIGTFAKKSFTFNDFIKQDFEIVKLQNSRRNDIFGNGTASKIIARTLKEFLI